MLSLLRISIGVLVGAELARGFINPSLGNFRQQLTTQLFAAENSAIDFNALDGKRILVVGGSGRVGGSVVTQLIKRGASHVTVGGTSEERFEQSRSRWQQLFEEEGVNFDSNKVDFSVVNRESTASLSSVLEKSSYDLVVHTAGPFQGKVNAKNGVLEACVTNKVAYLDVCDDYCTASAAKSKYEKLAIENGVPCLLSTGCWPGVSSLMAKQLVWRALKANPELSAADLTIDFSFFTAGSGGAGATLLVATFLILAEQALTIVDGRRRPVQAMNDYSRVNFGNIIGDRDIAHLNLLETASVHDILGVGNVKSLFGTAPDFWNTLLGVMAKLPPSFLSNEDLMEKLAIFSLPIVRVVDYFAGATNAMRCVVTSTKDSSIDATMLYGHENLEPCVGECVVAFCCAVLSGSVKPGVSFTEEAIESGSDAAAVLSLASIGCHTVEVEGTIDISRDEVWGNLEALQQVVAKVQ